MEKSNYSEQIDKLLPGVVVSTVKKLETTPDGKQPKYRFLDMCREKYSIDGKWETLLAKYSFVKADVVAMDSPLPPKSRPSLGVASGIIPKSGLKKERMETRLKELQNLAKLEKFAQFDKELMSDPVACVYGMYESVEHSLLYGLSHGAIVTTEDDNTGTTSRIDFGYPEENQYEVNWDDPKTSTPLDDIEALVDKAEGSISVLLMDRVAYKKIRDSHQVRSAVFADGGGVVVDGANLRRPSLNVLNDFLQTEYGLVIDVVQRTIKAEKNGNPIELTPWKEGTIVAIPDYNVADLVYTEPAEDQARVEGVNYSKPKDWMLLSIYRRNEPALAEVTSVQGIVYPIINNVGGIYTIDTKKK